MEIHLFNPVRTVMFVGMSLSQVGEFSFVLTKTGIEYGLLTQNTYQLFFAVSVLTMAATPFVMNLMPYEVSEMRLTGLSQRCAQMVAKYFEAVSRIPFPLLKWGFNYPILIAP